jgi:hypothetical protein
MSAPVAVAVGFVGKLPLAGMMLYNLHYLAGLAELGYEVHYVERQNGPEYYDPRLNAMTEDVAGGLETLAAVLPRAGIAPGRFSLVGEDGQCHGAGWEALNDALDRARFVLTIADTTWFEQLERCPRRLFVDGDPLFTQAGMVNGDPDFLALEKYDTLYTYCTRMGKNGCAVPDAGREWIPTRPVVATGLWEAGSVSMDGGAPVTTVMNWSAGSDVRLGGEVYRHKGPELERLIDLPARTQRRFVLAAGGPAPRDHLQAEGWELANPLEVTGSLDAYGEFIAGSYADLGIAKHAYVASGSGWFSDRSTCYLGSGRPVLHQQTGFTEWLPTGEGVFAFSSADDAVEALELIEADYERHARAARALAEEHFEARTVIGRMLEEADLA